MTQPLEGSPRRGAEPAVALARLTSRAEFIRLMKSQPPIAFDFFCDKIGLMPADPQKPGIRTTTIGQIPVEVKVISNYSLAVLKIPMTRDEVDNFRRSCESQGLDSSFITGFNSGPSQRDHTLEIEANFRYGQISIHATAFFRPEGEEGDNVRFGFVRVSPEVFAELVVDMLEPQGIEGADRADAADNLILLSDDEAQLARLIAENPGSAWYRIREILQPLNLEEGRDELVRIGNTVIALRKYWWGLELSFVGEESDLGQVMQSVGGDGLSESVLKPLAARIEGSYILTITADFDSIVLRGAKPIASASGFPEPVEVNPKFLAALIMRIRPEENRGTQSVVEIPALDARDERRRQAGLVDRFLERVEKRLSDSPVEATSASAVPQTGEKAQAGPAGGEVASLTVEHLVALMRTNPRRVFAEIRRRIALEGSVGTANIGRTQAMVEIVDDNKLKLSFEIDYPNLLEFRKICNSAGLSKAFKDALALGIRNGKYVLEIEALAGDSGVQINALSRDNGGLRRQQGEIQIVSCEVFTELVGMLGNSSTVRPRISSHRDDEGKRGHKFKPLNLTEIRRRHK